MRNENERTREILESRGYSVCVMPSYVYYGAPVALILFFPTFDEIRKEADEITFNGLDTVLIVITEKRLCYLIERLFPESFIVALDPSFSIKELMMSIQVRVEKETPFLTEREERVMKEVGFGMSNKEIAQRMNKSERQVRRIKESIFNKTGLVSSEQLMLYYLYRINTRSS